MKTSTIIAMGAEAVISLEEHSSDFKKAWTEKTLVVKKRVEKSYRIPELDRKIRLERTKAEARIMVEARRNGVPTPIIRDAGEFEIRMEYIQGTPLKEEITPELASSVGELVGRLHNAGIIHGDLTTSNLLKNTIGKIYLIDFGLSYFDQGIEAQGVDVHVLFQTLNSTHQNPEKLIEAFKKGYRKTHTRADIVLSRVKEIEKRGRYS